MAKRKIRATEYQCDDCQTVVIYAADDPEPPLGYQGTVFLHHRSGGVSTEWFCCVDCDPGQAIHNALVREDQ